jgi:hypothetical protein
MDKIHYTKWLSFRRDYYRRKYNLWLGQAFLNTFFPGSQDPRLFYAKNKEAVELIETYYVDWRRKEYP